MQEGLQQARVQQAQFLGEPVATGKRLVEIKAIRAAWIKHEMEAELDDEQGMLEQEAAQLAGVGEAFVLTKEEGFEVGALRMSRASTGRALSLPVVNDRPLKQGKEGAILHNHGIMLKQSGHHRVVKQIRRGYHSKQLLLLGEMGLLLLCKRSAPAVKGTRTFVLKRNSRLSNKLLATVLMDGRFEL